MENKSCFIFLSDFPNLKGFQTSGKIWQFSRKVIHGIKKMSNKTSGFPAMLPENE